VYPVTRRTPIATDVVRLDVLAPRVAARRQAGQFVIVRLHEGSERIPLTIAAADPAAGTVTLVIQAVGQSTSELVEVQVGDSVRDVAGPLGRPTGLIEHGRAVCVGGGVGTAVIWPIAAALHANGVAVTSVVGARSADRLVLVDELTQLGEVAICTDDGSLGRAGVVTDTLAALCAHHPPDVVYLVGPVAMMKAGAEVTRPLGIRTIASLNAVMVDGTGMCGGCRVSVGGRTAYACVDGPEFDAHHVDFDVLADRLSTYREFESRAAGRCKLPEAVSVP
jgi:ferredoxin--NADP+ reductase